MGDADQAEVDELVEGQANWVSTRFSTSPAQASAVLLVAYSAAVSFTRDDDGVRFWMRHFDGAARMLRSERSRLGLWSRDPLLRDLRPIAHLLDLRRPGAVLDDLHHLPRHADVPPASAAVLAPPVRRPAP